MRHLGKARPAAAVLGYGLLAAALAAFPIVAPATPAAAAPVTVLANDFESGSYTPWGPRGPVTLELAADGHESATSLAVTGRTANWNGVATDATALFQAGETYSVTAFVKLPAGTAGSSGIHFTVEQTPAGGGDNQYTWIGGSVATTADGWVQIGGSYTFPADLSAASLYVEAEGTTPFLLDDVLITGEAAVTTISAVDFEDGTTGTWSASGSPALAYVPDPDDAANTVLSVSGRTAGYFTVQSLTGLFTEGVEYTMSARVRPASEGATRFVVKEGYHWVGNTTTPAGAWTTVTGTFTADADDTQVYIEVDPATADFLLDDILITAPDTGGPVLPPDFVPGGAINPVTTPVMLADGAGNVSALTFDDGPNPAVTPALLDYLKANGLHATFCVIGQNIQATGGAEILQRIVREGHVLCNHSTSYADMGSWTPQQVQTDLIANLDIIRTALSDPYAKVPFFRAPNGSWGATPQVAVDLGMQPLAVVNTISDWETQDVPTLTDNLRAAMKPGEIVLAHDGGGDRSGTLAAVQTVVSERLADGWSFVFPKGTPPFSGVVLSTDFEDGLDGWGLRDSSGTGATVAVTDADAHGGAYSALVANRGNQGDGLGHDVTGILQPGVGYDLTAWVRFPEGATTDQVWLSLAATSEGATSFSTLAQFEGVTNTGWTQVTASFTMPAAFDSALLYFETRYDSDDPIANTSDFLVDDVVVEVPAPGQVQDLTPLKDTVDFPLGVAIDSRETSGSPSDLLLRHFNQITAENHMKVESWYDGQTFRRHPEATALLDFAQQNDLAVYGHVLVWHSQTPAWFFQNDGVDLTNSEADKQFLRDRLRTHIFDVAASIAGDYGPYGSDTNPVTAFDVVNEVVSDAATPDGLRTSRWYEILGEEYIHLAFQYADEAFNSQNAAAGVDRPVKLFINDYNTEQGGKQDQYYALVERLLAAGVPVDGVGHQFHSSLTTPPAALAQTLERFSALGLLQAVTELDATVGTPVTEAKLIEQGHWYRDAFAVFRAYQAAHGDLFSVTVWGLTDNRSWRSTQAPLLFDGALQAKYAYYGAAGDDDGVPPLITAANVFGGDVPLDATAADSVAWHNLPAEALTGSAGEFVPRWTPDHLVVLATAADDAADAIVVQYGDATATVARDGTVSGVAGAAAMVFDDPAGWRAVVHLPHTDVAVGTQAQLDVRVLAGADVVGAWNSPGSTGTLTFLEDLSFLEVAAADEAPGVDGVIDPVWADANVVHTGKTVEGSTEGATADVRTLWLGDDTLYVLYEVTDPVIDVAGSDPWNQDSVELFLDLGNAKSGGYGPNDAQMRISVDNVTSFGTGDAAAQAARLTSATALTATGYVVELAVKLAGESGGQNDVPLGGADTFQGLDFQVNDGRAGSRYSVHTWAEPTGTGYQTTARWGVGHLVAPAQVPAAPSITVHPQDVTGVKGGTVTLIAAADGYPAPTVQWQWRQGKGGPFHDLAGADEPTLVLSGVTSVLNARQYRAVFTNSEGTATTDVATVTVRPAKGGPAVAG